MQTPKTEKQLGILADVVNKEIQDACNLAAAEARLGALREHETKLEAGFSGFERHKVWSSVEEIEGDDREAALARNNQIVARICVVIDFLRAHPKAALADIERLGIPLPQSMDPAVLIMVMRCNRILAKYDEHKNRLMGSMFELMRSVPAEG
jgi:hypothetical protein